MCKFIFVNEWFSTARDNDDIERLRRLKEISENNRDHKKAQDFHVMEMQAARWRESKWAGRFFEFGFQKLGDYGRSELRPISWMAGIWLAFASVYTWLSDTALGFWNKLSTALAFSVGQMFPFVPSSRGARLDSAKMLFLDGPTNLVYGFTFLQSLISIVLLFLLGLALRNRFRV